MSAARGHPLHPCGQVPAVRALPDLQKCKERDSNTRVLDLED